MIDNGGAEASAIAAIAVAHSMRDASRQFNGFTKSSEPAVRSMVKNIGIWADSGRAAFRERRHSAQLTSVFELNAPLLLICIAETSSSSMTARSVRTRQCDFRLLVPRPQFQGTFSVLVL